MGGTDSWLVESSSEPVTRDCLGHDIGEWVPDYQQSSCYPVTSRQTATTTAKTAISIPPSPTKTPNTSNITARTDPGYGLNLSPRIVEGLNRGRETVVVALRSALFAGGVY